MTTNSKTEIKNNSIDKITNNYKNNILDKTAGKLQSNQLNLT